MAQITKKFSLKGIDQVKLLGFQDANLKIIRRNFGAKITIRGSEVTLEGDPEEVRRVEKLFSELILMINRDGGVAQKDLEVLINLVKAEGGVEEEGLNSVILYAKNELIRPKSKGQEAYYLSTQKNDIVFVIGPAGTGKTYLAVAIAVASLKERSVERIILTRPAVEAGESLGFLPGDILEKVDPYLRPLYDALYDMLPSDQLRRLLEKRIIEVAPLAYMRGRTLNNAYVILDEAQNTTSLQMKMFLTRLGVNSKAIITGDITQVDLPDKDNSGLIQIQSILKGIQGIDFVYLTERDVVRHPLVREIIKAYDDFDGKKRDVEAQRNNKQD